MARVRRLGQKRTVVGFHWARARSDARLADPVVRALLEISRLDSPVGPFCEALINARFFLPEEGRSQVVVRGRVMPSR